ncbi:MAG TPA: MCE family protein [Aeromicrobium sp.]|nr:MCE family protein [Aeromicrobium sp.]HKY57363.1 MCE family protein [Aeromicrobium sp.]
MTPVMRGTAARVLVLLAAALVLSGCRGLQAYDLPFPGRQVDPDDGYQLTAEFADVVDVVPRTLVLMNDVPVGQVDEVERSGWNARVTMTLRKDIELPSDTQLDIRKTSLLGEKYIALLPPETPTGAGPLRDGAVISLAQTGRNPDVEEVLGSLSFVLARGGVGQLKTISTELNAMMTGRTDNLRSVLERLEVAVGTLDQSKSQVIEAMEQLDKLTKTLNKEREAIDGALESFGPALEVLHEQHDDLVDLLEGLDRLGVVATRVINTSGDNIVESLRLLRPVLNQLADAGDSLPRGLMMLASFPFPRQSATLARGNYSNTLFHLELDLNQVVQGLLTGENTGLPQLIQLCAVYSPQCDQIQPLVRALCDLTGEDIACSAVQPAAATAEQPSAATTTAGPAATKTPGPLDPITGVAPGASDGTKPGILPGLSDELSNLLNPLLKGGGR